MLLPLEGLEGITSIVIIREKKYATGRQFAMSYSLLRLGCEHGEKHGNGVWEGLYVAGWPVGDGMIRV